MKKLVAGGAIAASIVAGSVAVAAVNPLGIASAQSGQATATAPDQGGQEGQRMVNSVLDDLVAEGTITADQKAAIVEKFQARFEQFKENHPRLAGRLANRHAVIKELGQDIAAQLNMSTDDLRTALKDGKSLNQIAADQGVDPAAVAQTITDDIDGRIDQAVADGKLDETKANEIKAKVPDRVAKLMDRTRGDNGGN